MWLNLNKLCTPLITDDLQPCYVLNYDFALWRTHCTLLYITLISVTRNLNNE
jgi:hypothetical protein